MAYIGDDKQYKVKINYFSYDESSIEEIDIQDTSSFQEQSGDVFEPVRNRLRSNKGRIRKMKADYLFTHYSMP